MKMAPDLHDVGRFWADYVAAGLDRGLTVRDTLPDSQVFDIRLKDLRDSARATLAGMYEHLDLPCDDALLDRLQATAAAKPTQQHGVHNYSLEEYGLDADELRVRFGAYRERFGV